MHNLWDELLQVNKYPTKPSEPLPDSGRQGNAFAVVCPVDIEIDSAARRNAELMTERLERGMLFGVVVEVNDTSAQGANATPTQGDEPPTRSIPDGLSDAISSNIASAFQPKSDLLVLYVTSLSAIDPNSVAAVVTQTNPTLAARTVLVIDAPLLTPYTPQAAGSPSPPPLLAPQGSTAGHMTVKILHALLDLGDNGRMASLAGIASMLPDAAALQHGQSPAATLAWSNRPLVSAAKTTFITVVSQAVRCAPGSDQPVVPDGKTVGGNLKRTIVASKIRLVLEKAKQAYVVAPWAGKTLPEDVPVLEEAETMMQNAFPPNGPTALPGGAVPAVTFASHDGRVHGTLPLDANAIGPMAKVLADGGVKLVDPVSGAVIDGTPYVAAAFRFEVVVGYREFLYMDSISRVRQPSTGGGDSTKSILLEDLGKPTVDDATPPPIVDPSPLMLQSVSTGSFAYSRPTSPKVKSSVGARRKSVEVHVQQAVSPPAPQPQPQPQPQPVTMLPPPVPSSTVGMMSEDHVLHLIEERVSRAVAREREARDREVSSLRDQFEHDLRASRDRAAADKEARHHEVEDLKREVADIRANAAGRAAVEQAIEGVQGQMQQVLRNQTETQAELESAGGGRAVRDIRHTQENVDLVIRQAREDIAAIAGTLRQVEGEVSNGRGRFLGLEQKQASISRDVKELHDAAVAARAVSAAQPEVLSVVRELGNRVKVVEVAIDRLFTGASADLAQHAQRLNNVEAAVNKADAMIRDCHQIVSGNAKSPFCTIRDVETISGSAANTAAVKSTDYANKRFERSDEAIRSLQHHTRVLQEQVEGLTHYANQQLTLQHQQPQQGPPPASSGSTASGRANSVAGAGGGSGGATLDGAQMAIIRNDVGRVDEALQQVQVRLSTMSAQQELLKQQVSVVIGSGAAGGTGQSGNASAVSAAAAPSSSSGMDALRQQCAKTSTDVREMKERINQLELMRTDVDNVVESCGTNEERIHRLDLRVDALEAAAPPPAAGSGVVPMAASASTARLLGKGSTHSSASHLV